MRVYVPATLAMLQKLVADRTISAVNGTAFAVTPALRESYSEGDDDELAEVALREAALASVRLLAGAADEPASGLPPRRAVLVAEVDGATARPDLDDAVVRLAGPIAIDDARMYPNELVSPVRRGSASAVGAKATGRASHSQQRASGETLAATRQPS